LKSVPGKDHRSIDHIISLFAKFDLFAGRSRSGVNVSSSFEDLIRFDTLIISKTMFGTLLKSVSMFKEKVSQEIGDRMVRLSLPPSTFNSLGISHHKYDNDHLELVLAFQGLSESYGALWEPSENVENCRGCGAKFQLPLLKRKHHCRYIKRSYVWSEMGYGNV
jgi:FYVE zinc finger